MRDRDQRRLDVLGTVLRDANAEMALHPFGETTLPRVVEPIAPEGLFAGPRASRLRP
jgi:hypothetical protein